jgi:hypothetical protein
VLLCPRSWATCTPLLEHRAAAITFQCDAEDAVPFGQQMLTFGGKAGGPAAVAGSAPASSGAGRHSYFRARRLQRVAASF